MAHQPPEPDRPAAEHPAAKSAPPPRDPAHDLGPDASELPEPVDPWADTDATPWLFGAAPGGAARPELDAAEPDTSEPEAPTATEPGPEQGDATRRYATPAPTRQFPAPPPTRPMPTAAPARQPAAPPPAAARPPARPPALPAPALRPPAAPGPPRVSAPPVPPGPPQVSAPPVPLPVAKPPRAPRQRRRRWPLRLLLATVLGLACCCGVPGYYIQPAWNQYPAAVDMREEVGDLRLRDDDRSEKAAEELANDMLGAHLLADEAFAGVYSTGAGKRVTIFGSTGFRLTPESDVNDEIGRLTGRYRLTGVREMPTGERGAHLRCGTGQDGGESVVLCTWADHGSLGTGLFTQLSVDDSARQLAAFRERLIVRG